MWQLEETSRRGIHGRGRSTGATKKKDWEQTPKKHTGHHTLAKPAETLRVDEDVISWEPARIFVDMALVDLSGSSWAAIRHRLAKAQRALRKRAPLCRSKWMKGKRKLQLMTGLVWASLLWGSALWTLTKAMNNAVDSWSARTTSTILGIQREVLEGIDVCGGVGSTERDTQRSAERT